jgi:hypothetical protein
MQFGFNSDAAYMISQASNPTPDQLGILQSASLDFKASVKKLYGQNILPVAAGSFQIDVTGKAKFTQYRARIFADFFGSSMSTGQTLIASNEADTVPATSPFARF